jgi:hypothetical protein
MPGRPVPIDITENADAAVTEDLLAIKPRGRGRLEPVGGAAPVQAQLAQDAPAAAQAPPAPKPEMPPSMKMLASLETTLAAWRAILGNEKTPDHARKLYEEKVLYLFAAKQELDPPPARPQQPEANGGATTPP